MPEFYIGNVRGPQGQPGVPGANGSSGATFTPSVNANGDISWTNDKGLLNPTPVNIRGPQGQPGRDGVDGTNGSNGRDGVDGKTPSVSFRYDATTGNLYYEVTDATNGDEVLW